MTKAANQPTIQAMKNKIALTVLVAAMMQSAPASAAVAAIAAIVAATSAQVAANNRAKEAAKKIEDEKLKTDKSRGK